MEEETLASMNVVTPEEVRVALHQIQYGRHLGRKFSSAVSIVHASINEAFYKGLKGEDLYTMLAWRALIRVEQLEQWQMEQIAKSPNPSFVVKP